MATRPKDLEYDISELVTRGLREKIPDPIVKDVLSSPPFVTLSGTFNVRDLSGPRTARNIRDGFIYRSGALTNITGLGMRKLVVDFEVRTIFDLREESEREKTPPPVIPGAEIVWIPYAAYRTRVDLKNFVRDDGGLSAFMDMYDDILKVLQPTYKAVFTHIRDNPTKPILFHCAAGKDRTGVLAALILKVAGAPNDAIAHDYLLTRVGTEPVRDSLPNSLRSAIQENEQDTSPTDAGMLAIMTVKEATITTFLEQSIDARYKNGIVGYLKGELGFNEADIEKMRVNLMALPLETGQEGAAVNVVSEGY
ncbi:hypothetical protein V490_04194 [Pseudogymnoascus sp. VKM F-3557]|nr:hypothetical protein V490_04194 [Pseudogymnoascus sp. VKM F-3557]